MAFLSILTVLVILTCANSSGGSDGPIAKTTYGAVRGLYVDEGKIFLGVPFAAPPTGVLRWRPPQPAKPWGPGVYNATQRTAGCLQFYCTDDPIGRCAPSRKKSEDCLYLNVFVPKTANAENRKPVVIFIHGGNYIQGTAMGLLYDSRYLASKTDTVFVAANYRLSSTGFLKAGQGKDAAMGNYGILDQIATMQWVQDNIASFGGDPNKVTLYGQDVGGFSVLIHMVNGKSDKLFHRAIISSTPASLYLKSQQDATVYGNDFAKILNCSQGDMKCLRAANESSILRAEKIVFHTYLDDFHLNSLFDPWAPIIDGDIITSQMMENFAAGRFQKKPLIVGKNAGDAFELVYGAFQKPMSETKYEAIVFGLFRLHTPAILNRYPPSGSGDERSMLASLITHFLYTCADRNIIRNATQEGDHQVWAYVLEHVLSYKFFWSNDTKYCNYHVCEYSDLMLFFHSMSVKGYHYTPQEDALVDSFAYYLGNFAHNSDPNKPARHSMQSKHNGMEEESGPVYWPEYNPKEKYPSLVVDTPQYRLTDDYLKDTCDFWNKLNVYP